MAIETVSREIAAPIQDVFKTITDIERYPELLPSVSGIEFIGEQRHGAGTRFHETRFASGRDGTSAVEVTGFVEGESITLRDEHMASTWSRTYTVTDQGGATLLTLGVQAEARKLVARLTMTLGIRGYRKNLEKDLDAIKAYCEAQS